VFESIRVILKIRQRRKTKIISGLTHKQGRVSWRSFIIKKKRIYDDERRTTKANISFI